MKRKPRVMKHPLHLLCYATNNDPLTIILIEITVDKTVSLITSDSKSCQVETKNLIKLPEAVIAGHPCLWLVMCVSLSKHWAQSGNLFLPE